MKTLLRSHARTRLTRHLAMLAITVGAGSAGIAAPAGAAADEKPESGEAEPKAAPEHRTPISYAGVESRRLFLDAARPLTFIFEHTDPEPRDLVVRAIHRRSGKTKRRWRFSDLEPGQRTSVDWNGKRTRRRGFARQGGYAFKVFDRGQGKADMRRAEGRKRFNVHGHHFPLPARHTYGDGFGAGRGHRGQDVFADCGRKIRAARGGTVQVRDSHAAAGQYLVIDARGSGKDYVYMHLQRRGLPREGQRVRTGERIGYNGATGNARGCHLHFEVWSAPGWYEGGSAAAVTKRLKRWDRWS